MRFLRRLPVISTIAIVLLHVTEVVGGTISNITVTLDDAAAGNRATCTVTFTPQSGLPADGKIVITFPAGFSLAGVSVASGTAGMNGGFLTPVKAGQVLTLTRDGSGDPTPMGVATGVVFSLLTNHTTAGSYSLTIETQNSADFRLDGPASSPPFAVTAGPLQRFEVSPPASAPQAGDNFTLTVTARDGFNNNTSFTGTVTLTDNTGTLTPTTLEFSNQSQQSTSVARITKAQAGIIIRATGGGKSGESAPFTVNPGSATQIVVAPLAATQTAGVAFLLTATAQDQFSNTVTGFNGTAEITPSTGTLSPTTGTFVNGVLNQSLAFQAVGTGNASITVQSGTLSGVSNAVQVLAGDAAGAITLTADPPKLPANGLKTTTIQSTVITDAFGNPVGAGRLFTVSVSDPNLGEIVGSDADPASPSFQVATTAASTLSFAFRAKTTGGTATIYVAGGANGAASGSVAVSVNQLRILSVTSDRDTISTDQENLAVKMVVQNLGRDPVQLISASLLFGGQTQGFQVQLKTPLPAIIPGNLQTVTLEFSVKAKDRTGIITLDGSVVGTVVDVGDIRDDNADPPLDQWVAQKAPELSFISGSLSPLTVTRGNAYQFSVTVRNTGDAAVNLIPNETKFEFGGLYLALLDANQTTRIPGNSFTKLTFQRQTVANQLLGNYTPTLTIRGTQNGSLFSPAPLRTDNLLVQDAAELEIVSVVPSQNTVTQGMGKDWTITMALRNNGSADMGLDNTTFEIQVNGVTASDYDVVRPTAFRNSGDNILRKDSTDYLEFKIRRTGSARGIALVFATVTTRIGDTRFEASTNGTQGSFVVQSPAKLRIALQPSQTTVTQRQTQDWRVTMTVENSGESDVHVLFKGAPPSISFARPNGFAIVPPASLEGAPGDSTVKGGTTRRLDFIIATTGTASGGNQISGVLTAREVNSDSIIIDDTRDAGGTSVTMQTPAVAAIDSTVLAGVFHGNRLNTGQPFQVRVVLRATPANEEALDSVRVKLVSDGASSIATDTITLKNPNRVAVFEVVAGPTATAREQLTATITAAFAANTKSQATINPAVDDTALIAIDRPAALRLLGVSTSLRNKKIAANSTESWRVSVALAADANAADVQLDPPQPLSLTINNEVKTDYVVETPTALKSGGLLLRSGQVDTLEYRISRVGRDGGDLAIRASVSGRDVNDRRQLTVTGSDTVQVISLTRVRIAKTIISSQPDGGVGAVNTNQSFSLNVDVNNIGFERLDSVWVTLRALRQATPRQQQLRLGPIDNGSTGTAVFVVTAPATPTPDGELESFEATIDSAFTPTTRARIAAAFDSTAAVRVHTPANLQLLASLPAVPNRQLTVGQTFTLRAVVSNLGQAPFDDSGRLQIVPPLPAGYAILDNAPRPFRDGVPVEWQITAPNFASAQDTLLVEIVALPRDLNDGTLADAATRTVMVIVDVNASTLALTSLAISEPAGARDRIVSTEQEFTVTAKVAASPNLSEVNGEITLPTGYSFLANEPSRKTVNGDSVGWRLKAPVGSHSTPREITVRLTAKNSKGEVEAPVAGTLTVQAEPRALLELTPEIYSPASARSGKVAVGQSFILRATLRNLGAPTSSLARVTLQVGETGLQLQQPAEQELVIDEETRVGYVEWQATAPALPTASRELTFTVTHVPVDLNAGEQAPMRNNGIANLSIETLDRGTIALTAFRIFAPAGAQDRSLSTEQRFTLAARAEWVRATNITARLLLPEGGGFVPEDQLVKLVSGAPGQEFYWDLTAPASTLDSAMFKIILTANDESDQSVTLGPEIDSLKIRVVKRANLLFSTKITSPETATDGVVSVGQSFQVAALLENLGEAEITGVDSVEIRLPANYQLDPAIDTSFVKRTSLVQGMRVATWQILAPLEPAGTQDIAITLLDPPDDANTGADAQVVDQDLRQRINIATEARKLIVTSVPLTRRPPVARGETNVPVMQLRLSDPGASQNSSDILLTGLRFYVRNRQGRHMAPGLLFKALRLIDEDLPGKLYGEIQLTPADQSNPVQLPLLVDSVAVGFDRTPRLTLRADLVAADTADAFLFAFDESTDLNAIDRDSRLPVQVVDDNNRSGAAFQINSALSVLFDPDAGTFYNYPNPFRPPETNDHSQGTHFIYNLTQDSEVEIKIFTLLGELVWERKFGANTPQGRRGAHVDDVFWNGFNDRGRKVLNGVYLAVIKTHAGTARTKVVVIK
ncbi:MAG: hypothetical protein ONB48_00630 [candidate division KSB1 bacterium]|nr:hypothetical protein [candidate division KSB1 bacterium]MDZ7284159.1 hypothetical protein [candidate division KSB1 bacterium]MDZ7297443.1 hypothetical protein [candidate division KSB1 bacterium]MDZ7305579.1 hypothetical protein [candidate division KSB1 bacterium]MDZ7348310.1 hypothetical protein [candidate division KSB1 bacterium]